jgi:hypothetical protein
MPVSARTLSENDRWICNLFPGLPDASRSSGTVHNVRKHALEAGQVVEIRLTFAKGLNLGFEGAAHG